MMRPEPGVALGGDRAEQVAHRIAGVAEVEAPAGHELRPEIDVARDDVGAGVVRIGIDGDGEIAGLAVVAALARMIRPRVCRKGAGGGPVVDQVITGPPNRVGPAYQIELSGALPPPSAAGLVQPAVMPGLAGAAEQGVGGRRVRGAEGHVGDDAAGLAGAVQSGVRCRVPPTSPPSGTSTAKPISSAESMRAATGPFSISDASRRVRWIVPWLWPISTNGRP